MFVRQSKYIDMNAQWEAKYLAALALANRRHAEHQATIHEFNALVRRINALGGETFLKHATLKTAALDISQDDIQRLLQLCHPDKHDGKQLAQDMTAKLLAMKERA